MLNGRAPVYIPTWDLVVVLILFFWVFTRASTTTVGEMKQKFEKAIKDLTEKHTQLEAAADDLRTQIDTLQSEQDSLQSETVNLRTDADALQNETVDLRTDVDALRNDLDRLGGSGGSTYIIHP
jgi:peptidoglycan hydrolase CwlO-like protein